MRNRLPNKTLVALLTAMPALACSGDAGVQGAQTSVLQSEQDAAYYMAAIEGVQGPDAGQLGDRTLAELMDEFGVPGLGVAVIHDFEIHWAKGYGVADVETGLMVDTETMFQAASISKPVTAMAALKAVQDGLFSLDDDINDVLESWELDGGEFTRDRPVTPRSLMSHVSGLGDGFGFPGYEPTAPLPTTVQILDGHELSNVGPVFMERPPMTFMEYSGGGVTVMQLAIADARGRDFADILRDDVLEPIGMVNSSFVQPITPENDRNAARAHDDNGESMGPKWHVYPEQAAAGLWTTPTDLARFAIEVQKSAVGESNRVLSRATVQEMLSPVGVGGYAVGLAVARRGLVFQPWGWELGLSVHPCRAQGQGIRARGHDQRAPRGSVDRGSRPKDSGRIRVGFHGRASPKRLAMVELF